MSQTRKNKAVFAVGFSAIILLSFSAVFTLYQNNSTSPIAHASKPTTLQVNLVSDKGVNPQLSANEPCLIQANVSALNQFGNESFAVSDSMNYTWTVTPNNGSAILSLNGFQNTFPADTPYTFSTEIGALNFSYASASAVEVWVHLDIRDTNASSPLFNQTASYSIVAHDPASFPAHYLTAATASANYIVQPDESKAWFYVVNCTTGQIISGYTSTVFSTTINAVLSNLDHTQIQKVESLGYNLLSAQLVFYTNTTFVNEGTIYQQYSGTPFTMVTNADHSNGNTNIDISGGTWLGGWNGTVIQDGDIFNFVGTSAHPCYDVKIHDLYTGLAYNSSICISNAVQSQIFHVWQLDGYQDYWSFINLESVSDSQVNNVIGASTKTSFSWNGGTSDQINDIFTGGGGYLGGVAVYLNGVNNLVANNWHIDYVHQGAIEFEYCQNDVVTGIQITGPAAAGYPAILMASCWNQTIVGGFVGQQDSVNTSGDTAYNYTYGIQETGNSGSDSYSGLTLQSCDSAYLINPTSYVFSCLFNGLPLSETNLLRGQTPTTSLLSTTTGTGLSSLSNIVDSNTTTNSSVAIVDQSTQYYSLLSVVFNMTNYETANPGKLYSVTFAVRIWNNASSTIAAFYFVNSDGTTYTTNSPSGVAYVNAQSSATSDSQIYYSNMPLVTSSNYFGIYFQLNSAAATEAHIAICDITAVPYG